MRSGGSGALTRNRRIVCVLINLFATPGLGSLMARRMIAGTGQLILSLAGFGLIMVWMLGLFSRSMSIALGEPVKESSSGWMLNWGLILFGAGWLWSLFTSVSILRHAEPEPEKPPVIAETPPGRTGLAHENHGE